MATPLPVAVPVIELGGHGLNGPTPTVVEQVADAAATFGFFQVVDHGIAPELIQRVWDQTAAFFGQAIDDKRRLLRSKENSRGYYDRELTKNARDLKEVLDIGHVPFPGLADDDVRNHHDVDGRNQWPDIDGFRATMVEYLTACETLSFRLLEAFAAGLGGAPDLLHQHFGEDHTSFVRLNHYPLTDLLTGDEAEDVTPLGDMALHHHSDAGALTVLLQDEVGGLQVHHDGAWIDVAPIEGALVVNTGDMMQVWSNDRYRAALHRVVSRTNRARSSLPYFFNPSYSTDYAPLPGSIAPGDDPHYRPINWGAFRQARADGDYADYGSEVQISDFRIGPESP
jgi:isopenicillin N synthase-like dioxygenase